MNPLPTHLRTAFLTGLLLPFFLAPAAGQSTSGEPSHRGVTRDSDQLLVVRIRAGSLGFLDLQSGRIRADIRLGRAPHEVAVDPGGRWAAVPEYGGTRLFIVDVQHRKLAQTIPLLRAGKKLVDGGPMPFYRPHGVTWSPDGSLLVTAEMQKHLLRIDRKTGGVTHAWPTGQSMSHMVVRRGGIAYVSNKTDGSVSVFSLPESAAKAQRIKNLPTGAGAQGMAFHPKTGNLWVGNILANTISVVSHERHAELAEFPCGVYPVRLAFTPDGDRLLVSNYQPGTVSVFDTKTRKELAEIQLPRLSADRAKAHPLPPHRRGFDERTPLPVGLLVAPDGRRAFVSCTRADQVHAIDLKTLTVARSYSVPGEPDGLAFLRGRDR